jgi:hypothetical protein
MAESWTLDGIYTEACTCQAACPCIMLSDPTEGDCTVLVGWHIERGGYGRTTLDGLNVAIGVHTPGNMKEKNWKAALYLDARASPEQREALVQIFGGHAGGHPAHIAEHIAEVAGIESVPITFESDGRAGRLRVGNVGASDWRPIEGQGGGPVTIEGTPFAISPGHALVVGRADRAHFRGHGIEFDASGRQAMVAPFRYSGP